MSNKTISSNLFLRISAIALLISLVFFLGLSMPNNAYGDIKEGKGETNASDNANKAAGDDVNDIEDDVEHIEDSIDVEEDANDVSDDINEIDDSTDVNGVCVDDCTDVNGVCVDDCKDANGVCVDDCTDVNNADMAKNGNSNSAADNVNKADDCVDINGICSDDDCDCTDVNGVCVDDCKDDNNTKKNASANSSSVSAGTSLEINKEKTLNNSSNSGTLSSAVKEINRAKEIKSLDDGLNAGNSAPNPVSKIESNEQLGAKEIIKLFFENVTLFFTNILDKIM